VGSHTIILGNNSEEDMLEMGTYHLKIYEGNILLLHDTL